MSEPTGRGVDRGLTSYADPGFSRFLRRAFLASAGFDADDLTRPVVGIAHTISDYVTCHRQMPELVEAIRRGVTQAGGLAMAFPVTGLGEILLSPTSMLFRNLAALEAETLIDAQPMDAVVFVGGCDKTVPAQLMAASSTNMRSIFVVAGPMQTNSWRGERLGACTDCRRMWTEHRAGRLDEGEIAQVGERLCSTAGTCMVMGTASTMACLTEALGLMLPGGATPPASTGARLRQGVQSGRAAVSLLRRAREVLTPAAFQNALTVLCALGGSTNGIIHLLAVARRAGVPLTLDDVDAVSRTTPVIVDCKPAGAGYLQDLDAAGGLPVVLKELEPLLDLSVIGVTGVSLGELLAVTPIAGKHQTMVRSLDDPVYPSGGIAVVRGSLAPGGAVLKAAAATPALLKHRGPVLVFESSEDVARRIDDPGLEVTPNHVLVLRNAGPKAAGMPEAGSLPIPAKLARAGVRDMVRVSDARMSGTAYGTVVLHVSPEAAAGGPLGLVRDGDLVELDARAGRLDLLVEDEELRRRRAEWRAPDLLANRGWGWLYSTHVLQADVGADLDFL